MGVNYYRLKQVDIDGNTDYSKTVTVTFEELVLQIDVSPNPVRDQATVVIDSKKKGMLELALYDVNGRLHSKSYYEIAKGKQTLKLNTSHFAKGVYYLHSQFMGISRVIRFVK